MSAAAKLSPREKFRELALELLRRRDARARMESLEELPAFAAQLDIRTKSNGVIRFARETWHSEQERFYEERTGRDIILKPRQIGITTFGCAEDVHFARKHAGVTVVIIAHDQRTTKRIFQGVHFMVESLVAEGIATVSTENAEEIVFADNKSTIMVLFAGATEETAAKTGRAGTIHRLHATEFAFWPHPATTMASVSRALTPDAEILIESTANGSSGLFYDACTAAMAGKGDLRFHFFPWLEHREYRRATGPGFDATERDEDERELRKAGADDEQIAYWRAALADELSGGREALLQELPRDAKSCFRSPQGAYVAAGAVDRLATGTVPPLREVEIIVERVVDERTIRNAFGALRVWEEPRGSAEYVAAADVAEGVGGDASTITVIDRRSARTVATFDSNTIEAGDFGLALAWVCRFYNDALAAPERNNNGIATIRAMTSEVTKVTPYAKIYTAEDGRLGWHTNTATRPVLFDDARMGIESGALTTPCAATAGEVRTLVRDSDGKPRAKGKGSKGGAKDDLAVSWFIGLQVRTRIGPGADPDAKARERPPDLMAAARRGTGAW